MRKAERITELAQDVEELSDISITGVCLKTASPFRSGSVIRLTMNAGEHALELQARVVHVRAKDGKHFNGIEFVGLAEKAKDVLTEMVDDYSRGVPIKVRILG